jgi:hypothetical protein
MPGGGRVRSRTSHREGLITCIGEEIVAVRWRQYRLYPKQFVGSAEMKRLYLDSSIFEAASPRSFSTSIALAVVIGFNSIVILPILPVNLNGTVYA